MLKLLLCLKYLSKRKVVFLSVVAVALSCALLISISSIFGSFITAVESAAVDHMGDVILGSPGGPLKIRKLDTLISKLEQLPEVEQATGVLSSHGLLLLGKGNVRRVTVWGIDSEKQNQITNFKNSLYFQKDTVGPISFNYGDRQEGAYGFVGIGVATSPDPETDEYSLDEAKGFLDQKVVLMTGVPKQFDDLSQSGFTRKTIAFKVSDLVFCGVHQFDSEFVYLPIDVLAKELYPYYEEPEGLADAVQIKLALGADPKKAISEIRICWEDFAVSFFNLNPAWFSYADPKMTVELQTQLITEYRKQMGMLMVIFGIISVGVIMLIACIFYMLILSKRRDIAIIKSFGGGNITVVSIFLSFGFTVGVVGSALGYVFGYLFTHNVNAIENFIRIVFGLKIWKSSIYMFDRIPNSVDYKAAMWIVIASIAAAVLGSVIPALVASRINPIKILRYE